MRGLRVWGAFRHHNYRLFFAGQLVSLVGTWMQSVAQGWLVLQLTNDPFALGLVAAAQFVPVLVLGLFGGLVADALPKRRTLIGTQAAQMLLAFALGLLTMTGRVEVWHILVLAFLLGVTNAVDMPTRQSFVVEMVGREDIGNAVGLNSSAFNAARIVGPAVAGLAIGYVGIAACFVLNGMSFLAVIVGYLLMRDDELRPAPAMARPRSGRAVVANLAEGLSYVRRTPIVLLGVSVVGLVATFGMNFNVVVPAMARDVLGVGSVGFGFLMAATGLGSLTAAVALAVAGRPRRSWIVGGAILLGVLLVGFSQSRSFTLSLLCMYGVGVGGIGMAATANAAIQTAVPDHLRGRVMSVYTTVFAGSTPIGGPVSGAIAASFGVATAVAFGGVMSALVGIGGLLWLRRRPAEPQLEPQLELPPELPLEPGLVPGHAGGMMAPAAEGVASRPGPPGP
ncbi:MAG: MFS transporter [Chloroflexi bacterium]|nr:MFS transporter [Chloroflexota bacterium]